MSRRPGQSRRRRTAIRIRVSSKAAELLKQAASIRGRPVTEFILESALREAEETILDQRCFFLSPKSHQKFLALLDCPAQPARDLVAKMRRTPSWHC
jgi:uncharacterized protein (DUF1778 family)